MSTKIQRADWVQVREYPGTIGLVRRLARDGSWADVDWFSHRKRMPAWSLEPLHTIQRGRWFITDVERKVELEMP